MADYEFASEASAWVMIPLLKNNGTECVLDMHPLVQCKDCKHWYPLTKTCNNVDGACCQSYVADDWFCADGVKKDG